MIQIFFDVSLMGKCIPQGFKIDKSLSILLLKVEKRFIQLIVQHLLMDRFSTSTKGWTMTYRFEALWDTLTHQADIKEDLNHARSYLSCISQKLHDEVEHY